MVTGEEGLEPFVNLKVESCKRSFKFDFKKQNHCRIFSEAVTA